MDNRGLLMNSTFTYIIREITPATPPALWRKAALPHPFLKWSFTIYCLEEDMLTHSRSLLCLPEGGTEENNYLCSERTLLGFMFCSLKNTHFISFSWNKICNKTLLKAIQWHSISLCLPITFSLRCVQTFNIWSNQREISVTKSSSYQGRHVQWKGSETWAESSILPVPGVSGAA